MSRSSPTPSYEGFAADPAAVFGWVRAAAAEADDAPAVADDEVAHAVRREIGRLVAVPPETLLAELDAALVDPGVSGALQRLEALGVVALLLPEVQALVGFHEACPVHHKDLWDHTLAVVARTPADADLRWAALLHDVGKIATRSLGGGGVAFLRHEAVGAWLARGIAARLAMPADRADRVAFIIEHHGRVNAYEPDWSERAVRRLVRDAGDRLRDLLDFSSADFTTRRSGKAERIRANLADLRRRIDAIDAADRAWRPPSGLGGALADALELDPGPIIGALLAHIAAQVAAGALPPDAVDDVYVAAAREHLTAS